MNRLVLIGNGFDLAHGIKTGYGDFIKWYLSYVYYRGQFGYEDKLIRVTRNELYFSQLGDEILTQEEISWDVNTAWDNGIDINKIGRHVQQYGKSAGTFLYPFKAECVSLLFSNLIGRCSVKRWVDVEEIFYETLLELLDSARLDRDRKEYMLGEINEAMRELIQFLQTYLSSLPDPKPIAKYQEIITSPIKSVDIESADPSQLFLYEDRYPNDIMLVNFNYTPTAEMYANSIETSPTRDVSLNYIHGELNSPSNPVVFGFGDELDKKYKEIEEHKSKGWFEHIKSFWYLKTDNYKRLIRFVDGGVYQVLILGHSCGLSDRTMLHMLLEHPFCKSIKMYYHGTPAENNYTETTHEIARHFNDKALMRKRVVNFHPKDRMPQYNDDESN